MITRLQESASGSGKKEKETSVRNSNYISFNEESPYTEYFTRFLVAYIKENIIGYCILTHDFNVLIC